MSKKQKSCFDVYFDKLVQEVWTSLRPIHPDMKNLVRIQTFDSRLCAKSLWDEVVSMKKNANGGAIKLTVLDKGIQKEVNLDFTVTTTASSNGTQPREKTAWAKIQKEADIFRMWLQV